MQQAARQKRMRLELKLELTLETEIVAQSFVSSSHVESSSNEKNSHVRKRSCVESASEHKPETSGAGRSNCNNYVVLNVPRHIMNDPSTIRICDRLKTIDNAATMIMS